MIVQLLDHWRDFFAEPSPRGDSAVGSEEAELSDNWTLFSSMARWPSVIELKRCVGLIEQMGSRGKRLDGSPKTPVHHRHLMAYTAYAEWRLVDKPIKRRDARGRWVDDVERSRDRVVAPWVNKRIVESALDVVLGLWDQSVPLELPPALTLKLRPLADADGWTEAA